MGNRIQNTGLGSLLITMVILAMFLAVVFLWGDELMGNDVEAEDPAEADIAELLIAMDKAHEASVDLIKAIERVERYRAGARCL